ncbi:MAG: N-6 DNA methylase [Chloroflexota bacterium]|nr:N-6 DNA methylase [Chloroflexota bacterium]MDE2941223.1 N-6 DNA methylase [Chloroflexota bacterium]MDE3267193.1 N-6 DNA methylase [Chloroflexota bacterium]
MTTHFEPTDPRFSEAAEQVLGRHNRNEAEANITSAVRDFLVLTDLAKPAEIVEETSPALGSRRAVDLTALDTFIEVKRRLGTTAGFDPNPAYVEQIDDYLAESSKQGSVRTGILTDGKYWLLRWPDAGVVKTYAPYGFTLERPDQGYLLYEWLRDNALKPETDIRPSKESVEGHFGPESITYQRDIAALGRLYKDYDSFGTIRVKKQLWENLLAATLGEIARDPAELDDLFVQHTYLTAVVGIIVQASFGIDIRKLAEIDPADLILGREFRNKTGLQGVVESDFFAWPAEVGGLPLLRTIARTVSKFDWQGSPNDIGAILYQTMIPRDERRQLGEYYTPAWLARTIVRELVTEPLNQTVLDPACGSGTFISEAVSHYLDAARGSKLEPQKILDGLRSAVAGIDVHPVAVHLARTAWVMAARPAIEAAAGWSSATSLTIPVYLGDALQLRYHTGDMFAQHNVTLQVEDDENTSLVFPRRLVELADSFDAFMGDVADALEHDHDPHFALSDHGITDPAEYRTLEETIEALRKLHNEGRNHIWAYYTRNLVRPVALSHNKVDVIVGNPPWINYNQTIGILRTELERMSRNVYGIWAGGNYSTHQDVAILFFARCVDLYLKNGGLIGMVLPHSVLQQGQHAKWRTGTWTDRGRLNSIAVDFGHKTPWDLETLNPNTFFPIASSVAFAKRLSPAAKGLPLQGEVERWFGTPGSPLVERRSMPIAEVSLGTSPYAKFSRQGATIVPRCLFYVQEAENPALVQAGGTVTLKPRKSSNDKEPWSKLDLTPLESQTIEEKHVQSMHLGETLAPYVILEPLRAALPVRRGEFRVPRDRDGEGGVRIADLDRLMRDRWRTIVGLWDENKANANNLKLVERLDYHGELSAQFAWQQDPEDRPIRVVYGSSGRPTAAIVADSQPLIDYTLFWITCLSTQEANYLLAIINSDALYESVSQLMPKGLFGARHLQKHLWRLRIPAFDASKALHLEVSKGGKAAGDGAKRQLARVRKEHPDAGVTRIRRELRDWLKTSRQGKAVESAVERLLSG